MTSLSGWVRHARHRAKQHGCTNDLTAEDALAVWAEHEGKCGYCRSAPATTLDNPLPLSEGGPNTPANLVPCCHECKRVKHNRSLSWLYGEGRLGEQDYLDLMRRLLGRRGADEMRQCYSRAIGLQ